MLQPFLHFGLLFFEQTFGGFFCPSRDCSAAQATWLASIVKKIFNYWIGFFQFQQQQHPAQNSRASTSEASQFSLSEHKFYFFFYSFFFDRKVGRMWLGMRVHYQITLLTRSNTPNRGPWGTVDLLSSGQALGTGHGTPHLVSRTPLQKCCNIFCPASENIIRDVYLVDI